MTRVRHSSTIAMFVCCALFFSAATANVAGDLSQAGEVKLSLNRFEKMMSDIEQLKANIKELNTPQVPEPPEPPSAGTAGLPLELKSNGVFYQNSNVSIVAHPELMVAQATHRFEIEVLREPKKPRKWTEIPLISSDYVVSSAKLYSTESSDIVASHFVVVNGAHTLLLDGYGKFYVEFSVNHLISRVHHVYSMTIAARQLFTDVHMTILDLPVVDDIQVVSQRAFVVVQSSEPGNTTATAVSMPTSGMELTWRDNYLTTSTPVDDEDDAEALAASVTVTMESLHSVQMNSIMSIHQMSYQMDPDATPVDQLAVGVCGDNVRVADVIGMHIDSWRVDSSEKENCVNVLVKLQRAVQGRYRLSLATEQLAAPEIDNFVLHTVAPLGVLRFSGRLAVTTAKNTVEIGQVKLIGVASASESEFSESIRMQTSRPLLLTYNYLSPDYVVQLMRRNHQSMDLLAAHISHAHTDIFVSEKHALHRVVATLHNQKRQFLRIQLPDNVVSVWGASINSDAVNPSRIDDHTILLPLLSTMIENELDGENTAASFDLVFLTSHEPINATESNDASLLEFQLPSLDIPSTLVSTTISFPKEFETSFSGTMGTARSRLARRAPEQLRSHRRGKAINDDYYQNILEDMVTDSPAMKINFPSSSDANVFHFEKTLVQPGSADRVRIQYRVPVKPSAVETFVERHRVQLFFLAAGLIATLGVGCFLITLCQRSNKVQRMAEQQQPHAPARRME